MLRCWASEILRRSLSRVPDFLYRTYDARLVQSGRGLCLRQSSLVREHDEV